MKSDYGKSPTVTVSICLKKCLNRGLKCKECRGFNKFVSMTKIKKNKEKT